MTSCTLDLTVLLLLRCHSLEAKWLPVCSEQDKCRLTLHRKLHEQLVVGLVDLNQAHYNIAKASQLCFLELLISQSFLAAPAAV